MGSLNAGSWCRMSRMGHLLNTWAEYDSPMARLMRTSRYLPLKSRILSWMILVASITLSLWLIATYRVTYVVSKRTPLTRVHETVHTMKS